MPPKPAQLSTLDVVEAFQLGHAVFTLHDLGVLESLKEPASAEAVATKHRLDPDFLRPILEYVTARTDVLRKFRGGFVATRNYSDGARYLLDMYAGTYGGNAVGLAKLARKPSLAPAATDPVRQARAFEAVGVAALGGVPAIIQQLQFNNVLDIGCGPAALLLQLATQDSTFVGWGLEKNPAMCKVARAAIRAARVGRRVKLIQGEAKRLRTVLPADVRSRIQTVLASHVANSMFGRGPSEVTRWLRGLRKLLPDRILLVSDYYGRLGFKTCHHRETLLHDYVQAISGQGVPPPNLAGWRKIYADADCRLVHVIEDTTTTRFIHVLVLGP